MTKREHFQNILTYARPEDVEFLNHEIELLDKRASAERKPTPKQVENDGLKSAIAKWMDADVLYTAADVTKGCPVLVEGGIKSQRVAAILGQMVKAGVLVKTEDKRKSFYSLA